MGPQLLPCSLCHAVGDSLSAVATRRYNSLLLETANFVVVPCIGPLIPGHVLIVSKVHHDSLATIGQVAVSEVMSILELVWKRKGYQNCLITEHGSFDDQLGGACIVHCHLHVIPEMRLYRDVLDPLLPSKEIDGLQLISNVSYPYILSMVANGAIKVYEAYNAHSQMMRKAICNILKRGDGDWKFYHDEAVNDATIQMWK